MGENFLSFASSFPFWARAIWFNSRVLACTRTMFWLVSEISEILRKTAESYGHLNLVPRYSCHWLLCTSSIVAVKFSAMGESVQTTRLLLIFLLVNTSLFISGSSVQDNCSKDGSCDENHGKEKYTVKGTNQCSLLWWVLYHISKEVN